MGLIVRSSDVHAAGVFTTTPIKKGRKVVEYTGPRITKEEGDKIYEHRDITYLFAVGKGARVIDGHGIAMFINHSCDPNCESVVEGRRVYIEAIRTIEPGTELTYDYQIQREDDDPPNIDEVFACRCGFAQCRGTMLWPTERKPARGKSPKRPARKQHAGKGSRQRAGGKRARDKGARGKRVAERSHEGGRSARNARDRRSAAGRGRAARRRAGKNKKGGRRG